MSTALVSPLTVGDLLDAQAKSREDHPFLICDEQTLTYAEASERSAALARGLIASGMGHGSRVGLLHPNGPEFVVAALAAARIGAVSVPLSTFSTAAELRTLLRNADIEMILAAPGYRRHDYLDTSLRGGPRPQFACTISLVLPIGSHTSTGGLRRPTTHHRPDLDGPVSPGCRTTDQP